MWLLRRWAVRSKGFGLRWGSDLCSLQGLRIVASRGAAFDGSQGWSEPKASETPGRRQEILSPRGIAHRTRYHV